MKKFMWFLLCRLSSNNCIFNQIGKKMNSFGTFCIFILKKVIKYRYKYIRINKM